MSRLLDKPVILKSKANVLRANNLIVENARGDRVVRNLRTNRSQRREYAKESFEKKLARDEAKLQRKLLREKKSEEQKESAPVVEQRRPSTEQIKRAELLQRNNNLDILRNAQREQQQRVDSSKQYYYSPERQEYVRVSDTQNAPSRDIDWQKTFGEGNSGSRLEAANELPWKARLDRTIKNSRLDIVSGSLVEFSRTGLDTAELIGRGVVNAPDYLTSGRVQTDLVRGRDATINFFKDPIGNLMVAGGMLSTQVKVNPERAIGETAFFAVTGNKKLQETLLGNIRRVPAFEPKVAVTRSTGRAALIESNTGAQLVLETETRRARLSKAPKGTRMSNLELEFAGMVSDGGVSARVTGTGRARVGRGTAQVSDISIGKPSEIFIGEELGVRQLSGPVSRVNVREVPIRPYQQTRIKDVDLSLVDLSGSKSYPFVEARIVNVRPSVRNVRTSVVDQPFSIDKFTSFDESALVGSLKRSPKRVVGDSVIVPKVYRDYVFISGDEYARFTQSNVVKGFDAPVKVDSRLSKPLFGDGGGLVGVTEKTSKKAVKTSSAKPVVSVEKLSTTRYYAPVSVDVINSDYEAIPSLKSNQSRNVVVGVDSELKKAQKSVYGVSSTSGGDSRLTSKSVINVSSINDITPRTAVMSDYAGVVDSGLRLDSTTVLKQSTSVKSSRRARPRGSPLINVDSDVGYDDERGLFDVFVRRRGVFKLLGRDLDKQTAIALGKARTSDTAAATFKIPGLNDKDFRDVDYYYKTGGLFIQKRSKRIKSVGEKQEISKKGQRVSKAKKKAKKKGGFGIGSFW